MSHYLLFCWSLCIYFATFQCSCCYADHYVLILVYPLSVCMCMWVCLYECVSMWAICVTESPPLLKMLSRNDTFPYDSVAFSKAANQGSGTGMSCCDAARRQAATTVCRLISASYCHFVKSHYSNENGSGRAVTEQGHGWVVCQRDSDFILPALFLNSESWVAGVEYGQKVVGSFCCVTCHWQGRSSCCLLVQPTHPGMCFQL